LQKIEIFKLAKSINFGKFKNIRNWCDFDGVEQKNNKISSICEKQMRVPQLEGGAGAAAATGLELGLQLLVLLLD